MAVEKQGATNKVQVWQCPSKVLPGFCQTVYIYIYVYI